MGARAFNARIETIAEKPTFKNSFLKRRCIVPANGYFEWQTNGADKTAHFIHTADGSPLAFAGLVGVWRPAESEPWLVSFSIVTTASRDLMETIHDRQPAMLDADNVDVWLDPASHPDDLFAAVAAPTPQLTWHASRQGRGQRPQQRAGTGRTDRRLTGPDRTQSQPRERRHHREQVEPP